jgi:hypothetical protein
LNEKILKASQNEWNKFSWKEERVHFRHIDYFTSKQIKTLKWKCTYFPIWLYLNECGVFSLYPRTKNPLFLLPLGDSLKNRMPGKTNAIGLHTLLIRAKEAQD